MERMKITTIGLTLACCVLGVATCLAADPQMGTWKLNEAKSKITPGTLKNTRVVCSSMFGQVKVESDGIDANGKSDTRRVVGQVRWKRLSSYRVRELGHSLLHEGERADIDNHQQEKWQGNGFGSDCYLSRWQNPHGHH